MSDTSNLTPIEILVVAGGFGKGKKCLSDKTIAEIHGQPNYKIRERISDNIKRFKESVDYIDLKKGIREADMFEILLSLGYAKQSITQAEHIYILSEHEVKYFNHRPLLQSLLQDSK